MKKITFIPTSKETSGFFDPPKPAKNCLPNWYKNIPRYRYSNMPMIDKNNSPNLNTTVKSCMPFRDAMTMGYIWELPQDLQVEKYEDGSIFINWRYNVSKDNNSQDLVTIHTDEVIKGLPRIENNTSSNVFKMLFNYIIETPKGYSCLYTQPFNRSNLPFNIFTGVVDTDRYPLDVTFPFEVIPSKVKDITIIEKGTPIVQIIPFKRESWNSTIKKPLDINQLNDRLFKLLSKIKHSYRSQFWFKKTFN